MTDLGRGETGLAPERAPKPATRTVVFAATAWVSLLCPAWQVFVTTSIPLYLNNQQDLYHNVSVIRPFLGLAMGVSLVAALVYLAALRSRVLAGLVWVYYLVGFAFLGIVTVRRWEIDLALELAAFVAIGIALLAVVFAASRWWDIRRASTYFAVFTVGFVATDAFQFATRHSELPDELNVQTSNRVSTHLEDVSDRPNFYHFVLDEYQTDLFEFVADSALRESLAGFVLFRDATTPFGRTRMALASLFSGRSFDFETAQVDYQRAAFSDRQSMLTQMSDTGYGTEAYLHERMFPFEPPFHRIRYHQTPTGYRGVSNGLFRDMWIYAHFPSSISRALIESDSFANFESQNVHDVSNTVRSLDTFRYLTQREPSQTGTGRYLFAHIILPHFPHVLEADCSYSNDEVKTDPARQAKCTNALVVGFLSTLKQLDRFRDALIVIQADHGASYAVRNGELQSVDRMEDYGNDWNTSRSRALLLIKLPGRDAEEPFETRPDPVSLLDVFPTVAAALGLDAGSAEGVDLFDPYAAATLSERQRWYYFFMKKGRSGWTDEMVRFRVEPGRVVRDGVEILRNNPRP